MTDTTTPTDSILSPQIANVTLQFTSWLPVEVDRVVSVRTVGNAKANRISAGKISVAIPTVSYAMGDVVESYELDDDGLPTYKHATVDRLMSLLTTSVLRQANQRYTCPRAENGEVFESLDVAKSALTLVENADRDMPTDWESLTSTPAQRALAALALVAEWNDLVELIKVEANLMDLSPVTRMVASADLHLPSGTKTLDLTALATQFVSAAWAIEHQMPLVMVTNYQDGAVLLLRAIAENAERSQSDLLWRYLGAIEVARNAQTAPVSDDAARLQEAIAAEMAEMAGADEVDPLKAMG